MKHNRENSFRIVSPWGTVTGFATPLLNPEEARMNHVTIRSLGLGVLISFVLSFCPLRAGSNGVSRETRSPNPYAPTLQKATTGAWTAYHRLIGSYYQRPVNRTRYRIEYRNYALWYQYMHRVLVAYKTWEQQQSSPTFSGRVRTRNASGTLAAVPRAEIRIWSYKSEDFVPNLDDPADHQVVTGGDGRFSVSEKSVSSVRSSWVERSGPPP